MKISPHITLALIGLSFPLLFGCASFERGVPQNVIILSFPTEASVYVNGDAVGITPMEMSLPRKLVHEIRLEKNGFNTAVKYFAFMRFASKSMGSMRRLNTLHPFLMMMRITSSALV